MTPAEARQALWELDKYLSSEAVTEIDLQEQIAILIELHSLKSDFSIVYDSFASHIKHLMEQNSVREIVMDSGVEVKCRASTPRKSWDSKSLLATVYDKLQQSSVDMDTGEVVLSTEEIVAKLLDYLQPSYWRVKALQEIGINADNYCEVGESKTQISIYNNKGENI